MKRVEILLVVFMIGFCLWGAIKRMQSNQNNDITKTSAINNTQETVMGQEDDGGLLSVLNNKIPFITAKGTTVYLKDYKPFYKYPEDVEYYEKDDIFIPREYTFVDLDKDGRKELIIAESPFADTYLILHKENDRIYGYSLYARWFESLKQDGTFISSGGALIHDYNTISFNENTYNVSPFAKFYFEANEEKYSSDKYYFEPDYEKSVFEIDGKKVSFERIKKFAEEWDKRLDVEWIEFK